MTQLVIIAGYTLAIVVASVMVKNNLADKFITTTREQIMNKDFLKATNSINLNKQNYEKN